MQHSNIHSDTTSSTVSTTDNSKHTNTDTDTGTDTPHSIMPSSSSSSSSHPPILKNDPSNNIFPYAIVWGALPLLSWLIPFIGHLGICDSQGVTHDFAGSYYVTKNEFMVGRVLRYYTVPIDKYAITAEEWDSAVYEADTEYSQQSHNILLNNCHHHTACALRHLSTLTISPSASSSLYSNNISANTRRSKFRNFTSWDAYWLVLFHGSWASKTAMIQALLPFIIIVVLISLLCGFLVK
jgi:hypothetical protein